MYGIGDDVDIVEIINRYLTLFCERVVLENGDGKGRRAALCQKDAVGIVQAEIGAVSDIDCPVADCFELGGWW